MKRWFLPLLLFLYMIVLICLGIVFVHLHPFYNRALSEIKVAETSGAEGLDLRIFRLITLPPEIGNLTNLSHLYLCCNYLIYLPPEIGNLANLKSLILPANYLTTLPPAIGRLSNLEFLSVVGNDLTSLPPEIGNLTNLRELWLNDNHLTSLPPEIGNLTNLTVLKLSGNPFDAPTEVLEQGDWAIFNYYANRSSSTK